MSLYLGEIFPSEFSSFTKFFSKHLLINAIKHILFYRYFRSLIDACGVCGEFAYAVDLLQMLNREGLLPDQQMINSTCRAFATDKKKERIKGITISDVRTKQVLYLNDYIFSSHLFV